MEQTYSVDELRKLALEYIEEAGFEATEPLRWFLSSLDPNKRYTTDDLSSVVDLLKEAFGE